MSAFSHTSIFLPDFITKKLPTYNFTRVGPSGAETFHGSGRTSRCRSVFSQLDQRNTRTGIRETFLSALHFYDIRLSTDGIAQFHWHFQQTRKQQNTRACFPTCNTLSPVCNPYTAATIQRRSAFTVVFCEQSSEQYLKLQSTAMWPRVA